MPNIASSSSPEVLGMIDLLWSIILAVVLTVLVGFVDIPYRAKTPIKACFVGALVTYIMLFAAGNTIATLLASVILSAKLPSSVQSGLPFFSAFLGVFAFHGVLSNTNITMFGKGALTFEDWLGKARTNTVAQANVRYVQLTNQQRLTAAYVLKDLPEDELNTYIAQYLIGRYF
jgi:hypothetical protein